MPIRHPLFLWFFLKKTPIPAYYVILVTLFPDHQKSIYRLLVYDFSLSGTFRIHFPHISRCP